MDNHNEHLTTLTEIRSLMERSSRFLSLSGMSGVAAGIVALIGAVVAYYFIGFEVDDASNGYFERVPTTKWGLPITTLLVLDAVIVFVVALSLGLWFSMRKAKKKGVKFWDRTAKKLTINLLIPLVSGGGFCIILLFKYQLIGLIAPATLLFYGLTLLNASKYTLDEIRYLGISEIVLGLVSTWFIGYGLFFWAVGFGVLHIVYGVVMYQKYDR